MALSAHPPGNTAKAWLSEAADALTSVFFPASCRICEELLLRANRVPICDACLSCFAPVPKHACEICGQPIESFYTEPAKGMLCPNCSPPRYAFVRARSLALYQDGLVNAVLMMKYQRVEPLAKWFAVKLADLVRREGEAFVADVIVPVPLHRNRERERGYNQAGLLAKPLAKALKLPYKPVLLVRTRERPARRCSPLRNAGRPYGAPLPHVQAAKLTTYASYW